MHSGLVHGCALTSTRACRRSPAVREATPQEGEGKHQPSSTPRPSPAPVDTKPTHAAESVTKLPARSEEPASQDPTTEAAPEDGLSREAPRHDGAVDRQVASIQPSAETQASRPQVPAPVEPLPKAEEELHDDSEDEEEEEEEEEPAEVGLPGKTNPRKRGFVGSAVPAFSPA